MNSIEFENVTFAYDNAPALERVSFQVKKGDYLGILGPNGSGKTTLLKLMLGALRPMEGAVRVQGKDAREIRNFSFAGYVPQHASQAHFRFPVTAEEVVRSGRVARMKLFSRFGKEDKEAIRAALEVTGMEALRAKRMDELSGGERQKVFIARALAGEPSMLVLDEPFTGVDEASQERFYDLLRRLNEGTGLTIILVSHDVDELVQEAKTVLVLNRSLQYIGSPEELDKAGMGSIHRHIGHD